MGAAKRARDLLSQEALPAMSSRDHSSRLSLMTKIIPVLRLRQLIYGLLFALAALTPGHPDTALAQTGSETRLEDPEPVIEATADTPTDQKIASRISEIYSQLDDLTKVTPAVKAGVVTLSGEVANEAQATRAQNIAIRVKGVVAVEDKIDRTLDVQSNVTPVLDQISELTLWFYRALPLLGLAVLIFAILAYGAYKLSRWDSLWRRIAPNPFLAELIGQAVRVVGVVAGLVIALNLVGATALMGTILGGAGVIGLTIGFAVRDSLGNYISSVMLSLRQPFRANDYVRIDDHEGVVIRLTSRATILMTADGNQLRIPNADVFKASILNFTRNPQRRFEFTLGVDADDDPLEAMKVGLAPLKALDFVLESPKPDAKITTVGDSNIGIWFAAWINQRESDFGRSRSVALAATKRALEDNGFSLPEPIYRLRFDQGAGVLQPPPDQSGPSGSTDARPARPAKPAGHADATDDEPLDQVDVSADKHLEAMAAQERAEDHESNLLDHSKPVE